MALPPSPPVQVGGFGRASWAQDVEDGLVDHETRIDALEAGGAGDVVGPSASVDKEIALFDSTTGKLLERATGTGYVKVTSGVMGTPVATVPLATDISGLGTGVATALAVNVGSAGAPVVNAGALGTPSSGIATNLTGLPLSTGVTGDLPLANLAPSAAASKLLGRGDSGAGDWEPVTIGSNLTMNGTTLDASITGGGGGTVTTSGSPASGNLAKFTGPTAIENTDLTGDVTTSGTSATTLKTAAKTRAITFSIDGGGSTITAGVKADVYVPYACTITAVTMLADQSGSIVVDIWKDAYANYPPVVGDSITASAKPTITTAVKSTDSTLTGWTTSVSAGDSLRFNVDNATSITRLSLTLTVTV